MKALSLSFIHIHWSLNFHRGFYIRQFVIVRIVSVYPHTRCFDRFRGLGANAYGDRIRNLAFDVGKFCFYEKYFV